MPSEPLSNQPQLALNKVQSEIIAAHVGNAINQMCGVQFRQDKQLDATFFYVYQQGRKDAFLEILNFDEAQLTAAKEAAANNSQAGA